MLKKKIIKVFGKNYYLIGVNQDGQKEYLEKAKFDCKWYWGIGYIETFSNNRSPENSRDISSHSHFDGMFLESDIYNSFEKHYREMVLDKNEIWKLLELMKSLYTLREYSDFLHIGGGHITGNPMREVLKGSQESKNEYIRINNFIIPQMLEKVYELLSKEKNIEQ